jgi:hypothetical protein
MRMPRLILALLLTLALFPWGAYVAIMTAAPMQGETVAVVGATASESSVASPSSLCHGPALNGSACHPLAGLLPARVEVPRHLQSGFRGEGSALWPEGLAPTPLLTPPRLT